MNTLYHRKACLTIAMLACGAFFGCGAVSDDPDVKDPIPLTPVKVTSCSEITDPWADSLVRVATQQAQTNFEQMGEALSGSDMSVVRASAPTSAEDKLDKVLAKYPSHCGAQFAKATLTLTHVVNSTELDTLVRLMNGSNEESSITSDDESNLFKMKAEDVPGKLFLSSTALNNGDPVTITRIQKAVETSI